jgi:predicted O-methyltransferase YrrM
LPDDAPSGLYAYYRTQEVLPTYAALADEAAVARYDAHRAAVLAQRVALPPSFFAGKHVLEFGPDSGENALVFARWGASLTLVEPNRRAHDVIRSYFARFGYADAVRALHDADVLAYQSDERYDVVVAEGFIYTVKPTRAWLDLFRRLLRDHGLFLITYYERSGALFELALAALHRVYRAATGDDAVTAAEHLYRAKWDAIPHTRAFASWVMDVLENPFVRSATCLDAATFAAEVATAGFAFHATFPAYDDPLAIGWHKRVPDRADRVARARTHLERSVLGFAAGTKLYLVDAYEASLAAAGIAELGAALDALDATVPASARPIADGFADLADLAQRAAAIDDGSGPRAAAVAAFRAFARAFALAADGRFDDLAAFTNGDEAFVASWGQPVHVAVGRAEPA